MITFTEPKELCEIKVGKFSYLTHKGELITVDFAINTCEESYQAKRVEDYNEQLTNEQSLYQKVA